MSARLDKLPQHEKPRRPKRTSPTARTLAHLRKQGFLAAVVERRLPYGFTTIDLFGFIDVVALDGQPGLLGVQTTTQNNAAARVSKIREECGDAARRWLAAGNRIEIHGWAKRGGRGKRKLWSVSVLRLELSALLDSPGLAAPTGGEVASEANDLFASSTETAG